MPRTTSKKTKSTSTKSSFPSVTLSDVATVLKTPLFKDEEGKRLKRTRVVSVPDLPDAGFVTVSSKTVKIGDSYSKAERYLLQAYDVLISDTGTIGKVAIFPEEFSGKWIAGSTMFAVRFKEKQKDNAVALYVFLKSQKGQALLNKLAKGKTVKVIPKRSFEKILIPEPTAEVKKEARAAYNKEIQAFRKIQEVKAGLEELYASYLDGST